jgi:hypothetical protein
MAPSTPASTPDRPSESRSSMSVARRPICNGEACIGRDVKAHRTDPGTPQPPQATKPAATTSSVDVAGQEQCRNDACIGLTDGKPSIRQAEGDEASDKN